MKLYAKTTSERASKGQGGEYLDIEITNENKDLIFTVKVRNEDLFNEISIWSETDNKYLKHQQPKAEKKKAELDTCKKCKSDKELVYNSEVMDNYCQTCGLWQNQ